MGKRKNVFMRLKAFASELENDMRRKKNGTFRMYLILRLLVIVAAVSAFVQGRYEYVFICALCLAFFLVPSFLERKLSIALPSTLEKIILLFAYAAWILGELHAYYTRIVWWDTMLHTLNGFLCAAVGFALVDILNRQERTKFQLSPFYLAIVAFCFSMTVGVLWEFFEFGMDYFFYLDMQKDTVLTSISSVMLHPDGAQTPVMIQGITEMTLNGAVLPVQGYLDIGLYDTMKDMLVNLIGAVVFSFIGYFYVKSRGENTFASGFIPVAVDAVEVIPIEGGSVVLESGEALQNEVKTPSADADDAR